MESIDLKIANSERFDEILEESRRDGLPECADLEIVTKELATTGGRSAVVLTWTVEDAGSLCRVQCVTTVNALATALGPLQAIQLREEADAEARRSQN